MLKHYLNLLELVVEELGELRSGLRICGNVERGELSHEARDNAVVLVGELVVGLLILVFLDFLVFLDSHSLRWLNSGLILLFIEFNLVGKQLHNFFNSFNWLRNCLIWFGRGLDLVLNSLLYLRDELILFLNSPSWLLFLNGRLNGAFNLLIRNLLFFFHHLWSFLFSGLAGLNISEHACDLLITGNFSHSAGLADVVAALVAPVEHVVLVEFKSLAYITAWLVGNLALNTSQSMVAWAADSLLLLLNLLVNKGTSFGFIALHFKFKFLIIRLAIKPYK